MNVSADALIELATVSGCPTTHRAEGVVRWAAEKLKRFPSRDQRIETAAVDLIVAWDALLPTNVRETNLGAMVSALRLAVGQGVVDRARAARGDS